ncbi:hypothetical protein [Amycolatopsis sp. PS_44_ISF1]|uniref:VOC family protein n=1 Tax=Amycolatopsis sp. PS_44_ISF1 TaxID=2974917 RepID=UPI0028DDC863|nr:hypothetical protein [Amycolatopsis sp. PS_44_ISF1]MDT8913727.1 hypothetical protein [Amycolatopsis sp. PS_44_ISF1]MDT8916212.1 hypothetical protein [Amycolatopsis sp. PS_44_ISF1]
MARLRSSQRGIASVIRLKTFDAAYLVGDRVAVPPLRPSRGHDENGGIAEVQVHSGVLFALRFGNERCGALVATGMRVLRTYARIYVADLDEVLPVLSQGTGAPVSTRFALPGGLELATVGRLLVLAGTQAALGPYRATQATLIVDDLDQCQAWLAAAGAELVRGPREVPTGRNLTARLADGVQVEYVEWSRDQWERDAAAS